MKKNVMMRVASIMLIMVLLTSSVISGTFAKYTTQDSGTDEARVAKWGVALQVIGNLYGDTYGSDNKIVANDATGVTVQSLNAQDDVVAPGTRNDEGFNFSLQGKPEVSGLITTTIAYENIYLKAGTYGLMVKVDPNVITAANFDEFWGTGLYTESAGTYTLATSFVPDATYYTLEDEVFVAVDYYPVEYAMKSGVGTDITYNNGYTAALTVDTLAEISKLICDAFGTVKTAAATVDGKTTATYTRSFNPNTDLQLDVALSNQNITWKWDFCQAGTCPDGDGACEHCKADTILGLLQAGEGDHLVNGEVVKWNGTNGYVAPVAAAGGNANDYNLETSFSIDITVTQEN